MSGKLIVGSNNQVPKEVVNLVALGVSDREFTSDDEGKVFLGENVEIDENGVLQGSVSPNALSVSSGEVTSAGYKNYFCDATGGAFTLTITSDLNEYTAVKTDATANTVLLQPVSGLINGAASYPLTSQYQKVTIIFDGANYYV